MSVLDLLFFPQDDWLSRLRDCVPLLERRQAALERTADGLREVREMLEAEMTSTIQDVHEEAENGPGPAASPSPDGGEGRKVLRRGLRAGERLEEAGPLADGGGEGGVPEEP